MSRTDIRFALPSKGRLEPESLAFLDACGLSIYKPNPRQYQATVPAVPDLSVLFQRPGDIVVGVRQGSLDFGISGLDAVEEKRGDGDDIIILHEALGFGSCQLALAVPEVWDDVLSVSDLVTRQAQQPDRLRVATKYPNLTRAYLAQHGLSDVKLIDSEGTLEVAPTIGYADLIADLVSTGTTLRDNRLRPLPDGVILKSQAVLIANRSALQQRPEVLAVARQLLEFIEAHLRAQGSYLVFANMRGDSPEAIEQFLFAQPHLSGLQGPNIAPIIARDGSAWYSVSIVIRKDLVMPTINELRAIGGSGVVVTPVTYIFEEEPPRYTQVLKLLREA
ncbi:MAG: ATP phosphoribosyltransferase [Chloroflexi bacterium]|nr:ATP phosphoribosyltransferase [Chloroflexota bacterium]